MNKIHKLTNIITELSFKIERLQEENEELKAKNAILILANSGIEEKNEQLNERVKTFTKPKYYYKGLQKTEEEKDKYKQALEEIKKWVTNHNPCDIEADINCTKEDCFDCLNYDIKKITKIINEVLEDTEDENRKTSGYGDIKMNNKLIKLNTPEYINVVPDKPLLEK